MKLLHTGVSMTDFAKLLLRKKEKRCIDVIKLRCKVSPTGCSIAVFSHSDKSRKQPLQRRRRRRKRPLARLAGTSQASQHFYQVWISYRKGNKEVRWRPYSRYESNTSSCHHPTTGSISFQFAHAFCGHIPRWICKIQPT